MSRAQDVALSISRRAALNRKFAQDEESLATRCVGRGDNTTASLHRSMASVYRGTAAAMDVWASDLTDRTPFALTLSRPLASAPIGRMR